MGKKETGTTWYLYAGSTAGSLVFILIAAGLAVLLWRRRRSNAKGDESQGDEEIEMEAKTTTPKKTKVKWNYSLVGKESKAPPTVV